MKIQYLEVVTPDADAFCATYASAYGVTFGDAIPELGNARTVDMAGGGRMGVRAPMHETEVPVVRPYVLVEDVAASVATAVEDGAEVMHPPMEIPGVGTFAILMQGGVQQGLWQL